MMFISDNFSKAHPKILNALWSVNSGKELAYGYDSYSQVALEKFKNLFGDDIDIHFVLNGTAANTLAIKTLLKPHQALISTDIAHLNANEGGSIEAIAGNKIITVPSIKGKIDIEMVERLINNVGILHLPQPKLIALSQSTEIGSVYSMDMLDKIKQLARSNSLRLYLDGARLAHAAVASGKSLKEICDGFDAIYFGGTKIGLMFGEVLIFKNKSLAQDFKYIQKQNMQLIPKARFVAIQYIRLFKENLWYENAMIANEMAYILERDLKVIDDVEILYPVETNLIFAKVPVKILDDIKLYASVVDKENCIIRCATSFDTTKEEINWFINYLKALV